MKTTITREELTDLVGSYDSIRDNAVKSENIPASTTAIIYGISILMWIMVHVFLQDNPKKK